LRRFLQFLQIRYLIDERWVKENVISSDGSGKRGHGIQPLNLQARATRNAQVAY
jgi:hypothetical protein